MALGGVVGQRRLVRELREENAALRVRLEEAHDDEALAQVLCPGREVTEFDGATLERAQRALRRQEAMR
jgi:hypothetical protein